MELSCVSVAIALCIVLGKVTCKVDISVEKQLESNQFVPFLVQLRAPPTQELNFDESLTRRAVDDRAQDIVNNLISYSQQSQSDILNYLEKMQQEGKVESFRSYYIANTIAVDGTKEVVHALRDFDSVQEISSNRPFSVQALSVVNTISNNATYVTWTGEEPHWSLQFINATHLPDSISTVASSLRYAIADTGVQYDHPALASNYLGLQSDGSYNHNYAWWDAIKSPQYNVSKRMCPIDSPFPCDDLEHGTHALSSAVGQMKLGVSPTTKWMACRNMDHGWGSPESFLSCLQFFLAPTDLQGANPDASLRPHVIGNSYSCLKIEGCSPTTFGIVFQNLKSAGIFLAVGIGNTGRKGCRTIDSPPATDPISFNVAASGYQSFQRANFSSLGPVETRINAVDIAAPGVNITGAIPGNKYFVKEGTSMATPHVAGAALLVMAACPHMKGKVDLISKVLRRSATPVLPRYNCGNDTLHTVPNNEMGWGVLNAGAAIKLCHMIWA